MARTKKEPSEMGTISKSETRWVTAYDENYEVKYVITSNKDRSTYYIYDKNLKKLGSSKSPGALEEKFFGEE